MWRASDVIVISDLHLSSGEQGQGLFGNDEGLEAFLLWILAQDNDCVVVLNGDIFDFLFADSKPGMDVDKLEQETESIIDNHKPIFNALGKLACSPKHSVIFLSGNHDPELVFHSVRKKVEAALSVDGHRAHVSWFVYGEALGLEIGGASVLIEHGDRLDPWNEIDRDLLNSTASLGSRKLIDYNEYVPPLGSKLVSQHLLSLRALYPWVELLKPEREAMLPLLRFLTSFKTKIDHSGALNLYFQAESRSRLTKHRQKLDPAARFRKEGEGPLSIGGKIKQMAQDILNSHGELKRKELIKQLREAARDDTFFKEDLPDGDYSSDLEFLLKKGSNLLIHGHTHSAKAYPVGAGLYLNSGTWARILRLPTADSDDTVWDTFLKSIENNAYSVEERPTYIRVSLGADNSTSAALHLWPKEEPLALWRFSKEQKWSRVL